MSVATGDEPPRKQPDEREERIHKQALERFKLGTEALAKQVKREKDDLQFQIPEPEFQWATEARQMRAGSTVGNIAVPAKPMLCIPKLDQPIQLVLNQEKAAHLGVQVHPLSEDADDDTAEVLQGLYRRIEVDSRANLARSWAYERAVKCGRGAYRVLTEYADDGGHFTDQKIVVKRLLHQESAVLDPFAEEPDWSDGRWGFVTSWMPWDRYKAKYSKSKLCGMDESELGELVAERPEWVRSEGEGRAVLVAEYFYLEYSTKTRVLLDDDSDCYDDEIPDGRTVHKSGHKRQEEVPNLKWCLINAVEILEEEDMDGKYIPIIPVIGRELIPFDQERRWAGIISQNKDGARMFNYAASQAVGVAALEPIAPFVLDPRQIENYEAYWNNANTKQFPYLPVTLDANKGWSVPQRTQIDAGRLGPSMMLLQSADSFLQAGTGAYKPALGDTDPSNKTKGGILAAQQQHEQGNSHFLDNLAQISLTYEAKVILDKIPYVYDRPGRVVRTLDLEDNSKTVMLNKPFVQGANGRPQPAGQVSPSTPPPGPPPGPPVGPPPQGMVPNPNAPPPPPPVPAPKVLNFDLKKGRYGIVVSVGKSYQNRAQQGKDELGNIFQAVPETFSLLGDLYFKFADFPGHREAAERMKKMLPGPLQEKDGPQAAEQELGQAKQALEQLQQQLKQAAQIIETDKVKQDAQIQIAQLKEQTALELQRMKDAGAIELQRMEGATAIRIKEIDAQIKGVLINHEAEHEAIALRQEQVHEERLEGANAAHELQMAQVQHQQAQDQAAQGQAHALEQGQQGQQAALEQAAQAAALQPPPEPMA